MKMKLKRLSTLMQDNRYLKIISVVVALIIWLVVGLTFKSDTEHMVSGVPVEVNIQSSTASRLGIQPIYDEKTKVDVKVEGKRYVVGNVLPEDITVSARLSSVTGPGTYDLPLDWVNTSGKEYSVVDISPKTIRVRFDRFSTKKYAIEGVLEGVSIPEGYVMENSYITPKEVTLTGPETDIVQVAKCVIKAQFDKTLEKTEVVKGNIELLDKNGNTLDLPNISMDYTEAEVTIPVLKKKSLPVTIGFLNQPENFDAAQLPYMLSTETIEVAGPVDAINNISEIHLGYVDIKDLRLDSSYSFDVELPSGFINLENIETVSVEFDMSNMESKVLHISNLQIINKPAGYDVTVNSQRINNVTLIGPKDMMAALSAGDVVAEIDISDRVIQTGQYKVPVKIYTPTKNLVWAVGDYTAIITVKARD